MAWRLAICPTSRSPFSVKRHHRGRGAAPFAVGDDHRLAALHHRDAAVGRSQVDADDLRHGLGLSPRSFRRRRRGWFRHGPPIGGRLSRAAPVDRATMTSAGRTSRSCRVKPRSTSVLTVFEREVRALLVPHGLVQVRVERLPTGAERLQSLLGQRVLEQLPRHPHALGEALPLSGPLAQVERTVEVVDDREQVLQDAFQAEADHLVPLALGPLARVVQVRRGAECALALLVDLGGELALPAPRAPRCAS